jgi:autotransporter-associated beta strand protein
VAGFCGFEIVSGSFGGSVGGAGILPITTPVTISNGATLDMTNMEQQISSLSSTDGLGSQVLVGSGALVISGTATSTFDGTISGAGGSLTLQVGTLTLSGTNTYTGGTYVQGGELIVTNRAALADGSSLTVGYAALFAQTPVVPSAAVAPVPEPGTLALAPGACMAALLCSIRRAGRRLRASENGETGLKKLAEGPL